MLRTIFGLGKRGQMDQGPGCASVRKANRGVMNRLLCACVALALGLAAPAWCYGANVRLYRLGEDDPGAVPLGPGDNPTVDHISGVNASKIGLEFYYGKKSLGGPAVSLGLAPGSTEAMEFTNIDSRYVAPAALLGVMENFGMEVYIMVSLGVTDANAFYNGGEGFPLALPNRGYGLGISGGFYAALVGGVIFPTSHPAVPGVPVEMALVNTGGGNFDVYIQRTLVLSFIGPVIPPAAGDVISMGNFVAGFSPPAFAGVLDEARVFTFPPGGFDPKTDLGERAVRPSHHHHGHKGRGPH